MIESISENKIVMNIFNLSNVNMIKLKKDNYKISDKIKCSPLKN